MLAKKILPGIGLVSLCVLSALIVPARGGNGQLNAELALRQLQADFHGAGALGDYDLMHSLWADDAVFHGPTGDIEGPDDIADFFKKGKYWGHSANLAPSYESRFDIQGNTATYRFECVIVSISDDDDPISVVLSSVPYGSQNSTVEIVQHSTAYGKAVKRGNRWVFQEFGPPPAK